MILSKHDAILRNKKKKSDRKTKGRKIKSNLFIGMKNKYFARADTKVKTKAEERKEKKSRY